MRTTRLLFVLLAVAGFFVPQKSVAGTPVDTAALVKQDSLNARSLIISEIMISTRSNVAWSYAEFYNTGETDLDMSRYFVSQSNFWGDGWNLEGYETSGKKHLRGTLKPGETYLLVQRYGNGTVDPWQNPVYPNGYTNHEASLIADYQGSFWSSGVDPDSIPEMKMLFDHLALAYCNQILEFNDSVYRDSMIIDRFGTDRGDRADNPGINWAIAGVTADNPTYAAVFVRKFGVREGNTVDYAGSSFNDVPIIQWDESRGTDISDSEWIPLPKSQNWEFDKIFTTLKAHSSQPEFSVTSDVATVDEAGELITLPYGTSRDSVFRLFTTGPNHAWELKLGSDTGQFFMQDDDSIFFYTVGEDLVTKKFGVKTSGDKTKTALVAPLVYKNDNDVFVRNYNISNGEAPLDTIGTLPYNLPVDTFYKYMVKEEGAAWEIIPASGTGSPELKNGDKLKVTAADGETVKEYYLGVRGFFPNHNADINTVYFPGLELWENPETYMMTDTMLNFQSNSTFYSIELPEGTTTSPAIVAIPNHHTSKVVINRAKDLKGADEDRTATIIVTAEDDTTIKEFKFLFNVERPTPPQRGELFFTDVATSWGGFNSSTNIQFFNPSDGAVDLTDYVFITYPNGSWDEMVNAFTTDSNFVANNKFIFRFGSIVENAEDGTPVYKADFIQNKIILGAKDIYHLCGRGGWPLIDAYKSDALKELTDKTVDYVFGGQKPLANTGWPQQGFHQYYAPKHWSAFDPVYDPYGTGEQPLSALRANLAEAHSKTWQTARFGLAKIVNDSIKDGTKHVMSDFDNDYEWVDVFGGRSYDPVTAKVYDNDTIYTFQGIGSKNGAFRKPFVYTGNPVDGLAFGLGNDDTKETVRESEWTLYGWGMELGAKHWNEGGWYNIRDQRLNNHVMISYAHISYLSSTVYLMDDGLEGPQQVYGVTEGTTVDQFMENVILADEGMVVKVMGSDGSELNGGDAISAGTNVWSWSASGMDSVNYVISTLGTLSSDCSLSSETYTVAKADTTGIISGITVGTTLEDLLKELTAPDQSKVAVTNGGEYIIPLAKYNNDTIEIQGKKMTLTLASTKTFVEVIAQDKVTKCVYALEFAANDDPFVLSDVYVIDQDNKVINFAVRTSPDRFKGNLVVSTGASIKVVNKYDQERTDGIMEYSDRLIVTKGDVSVEYWVNYTINEDIIGQSVKEVENNGLSVYPNPTTDFVTLSGINGNYVEIRDIAGKVISKQTISSTDHVVDMRSLSTGIYIISTKDASYKVVKE